MKHSFFELQSICGIKEDLSIEQRFLYKNGQLQKGSNVQEVFFKHWRVQDLRHQQVSSFWMWKLSIGMVYLLTYIHLSKWPRFVSTNLQSMIWEMSVCSCPFHAVHDGIEPFKRHSPVFCQDIQHKGHLWCSRKTLVFQIQASSIEVQLFQYVIEIFTKVTYYQGHTPPAGAFWKNRL